MKNNANANIPLRNTKPGSPSQDRFPTWKKALIVVAVVGMSVVIAIPVFFIVSVTTSCDAKIAELDKQSKVIQSRLDGLTAAHPELTASAHTNGDCLTGSGTNVQLESNAQYDRIQDGEAALLTHLASIQLPLPIGEIEYVSTKGYIRGNISSISYSRSLDDYESYSFNFDLQTIITCETISPRSMCAGGIPRETAITLDYLKDKPIKSSRVELNIRHSTHRIDK